MSLRSWELKEKVMYSTGRLKRNQVPLQLRALLRSLLQL